MSNVKSFSFLFCGILFKACFTQTAPVTDELQTQMMLFTHTVFWLHNRPAALKENAVSSGILY